MAVSGTVYLSSKRRTVEAYVATADLPAYHQIQERDLRQIPVSTTAMPDDPVVDRDTALGRYTLGVVDQDQPLRRSALGPVLADGALNGLGLVALARDAEVSMGGMLRSGDRVDLLLSPTTPRPGSAPILSNVLVLDIRDNAVMLAISTVDEQALSAVRGSSHPVLVRRAPYRRP
jgi:Flp pilus assembly protein CpaB